MRGLFFAADNYKLECREHFLTDGRRAARPCWTLDSVFTHWALLRLAVGLTALHTAHLLPKEH